MAGHGPAPKATAERRNKSEKPVRGDWKATPGRGWQHGPVPAAPDGLLKPSRDAWATWMGAWFASHWTVEDLPGLRILVKLYDQCERGEYQRASELRLQMDTYGITPKGQQDRRWAPEAPVESSKAPEAPVASRYGHLRAVGASE